MDIFMETIKEVVPVVITGIITFLITKYTYNKNVPLDKLEIAYNRIYYPIYQLLYDKKLKDVITNIPQISFYFQKYNKYVDRATLKSFDVFCKYKDKDTLQNFKNNIWNKNSYLRKRLGYLEPGFLQWFVYSSKTEKSTFRIFLEISFFYICAIIVNVLKDPTQTVVALIALICLIIIAIECLCIFIRFIRYRIK